MEFKVSHIFYEDIHCVDKLAKLRLESKLEYK